MNYPRGHESGYDGKNTLLKKVESGSNGSSQLLTLRLSTTEGLLTLVSIYAPILTATSEAKEEFHENLADTIGNIPSTEKLILLGDYNARVGTDHDSWPSFLGPC